MLAHEVEEERLLVRRVEIERAGADADLGRDFAHGHGRIARAREEAERRVADGGACDVGVRACFACHSAVLSEQAFSSM